MERKNKACWNCGNYRAYYTRGICNYDNTFCGKCNRKNTIVKNTDSCEMWVKIYKTKRIRDGIRLKVLERISEDVSMIKQIMEEEKKQEIIE